MKGYFVLCLASTSCNIYYFKKNLTRQITIIIITIRSSIVSRRHYYSFDDVIDVSPFCLWYVDKQL